MKKLIVACLLLLATINVRAADCEKALFGWDSGTGATAVHINGVFGNEGGYQNDPHDRGNFINGVNCGGAKYGISCATHPRLDIRSLTKQGAAKIYCADQWAQVHGDEIISQYLAYKLLDLAINTGTDTAIILFRQTVVDLNNDVKGMQPDLQSKSELTLSMKNMISWINEFTSNRERRHWFFDHLKIKAVDHYLRVVKRSPGNLRFLTIWVQRGIDDL